MPSFLDLVPEVRCIIYYHIFRQSNGEILGLSRQPAHNYDNGPPSDWIADSLQEGLVYSSNTARLAPTNSRFLRTCRHINNEATPVFYGTNRIILYAEDNNDIFYWLLDIGERNRRAIRHLEISWAYGLCIQSGRTNIRGILANIQDMEDAQEEEIQGHREQLIQVVQDLEDKTVRLIIRTLNLLVTNQDLSSLAVYLPGIDGADIWDLTNDNLYFEQEIFSNSTTNVHACIPAALAKMVGIKTLTIGYTKDIELAEDIARATGAQELIIRTCPEGHGLNLNSEERETWLGNRWRLEGKAAHKTLIAEPPALLERKKSVVQDAPFSREPSAEPGQLTASMLFKQARDAKIFEKSEEPLMDGREEYPGQAGRLAVDCS